MRNHDSVGLVTLMKGCVLRRLLRYTILTNSWIMVQANPRQWEIASWSDQLKDHNFPPIRSLKYLCYYLASRFRPMSIVMIRMAEHQLFELSRHLIAISSIHTAARRVAVSFTRKHSCSPCCVANCRSEKCAKLLNLLTLNYFL